MTTSLNEPGHTPRPALSAVLTRAMAREAPAQVVDTVVDWLSRVDGSALEDADRVTAVASLERLRGASSAAQARVTMSFAASTETLPPAVDPPSERARDRSIGLQLALARSESPSSGDGHLALARALTRDLPHTMRALTRGDISEEKAAAVHRATALLAPDTRRAVDARLSPDLASHNRFQVGEQARRLADELDPEASVERARHEAGERRVSARSGRDGMGYLTIHGPMLDVAGAMVSLGTYADSVAQGVVGDDPLLGRRRANVMTDHALELLSGRRPGQPQPVEVHVVVGAAGLFGPSGSPGPFAAGWSDNPKGPETQNPAQPPVASPKQDQQDRPAGPGPAPSPPCQEPGSGVTGSHAGEARAPDRSEAELALDPMTRPAGPKLSRGCDADIKPASAEVARPVDPVSPEPGPVGTWARPDRAVSSPRGDGVDPICDPGASSWPNWEVPDVHGPGIAPSAVIPGVGAMSSATLRAALGLCQEGSGPSRTVGGQCDRPVWLRRLFTDAAGTRLIGMERRRRHLPIQVRDWIARCGRESAAWAVAGRELEAGRTVEAGRTMVAGRTVAAGRTVEAGRAPVPSDVGRWLQELDRPPDRGDLVAWSSPHRGFTGLLRRFLVLRDLRCRTPFCAAPIRDIDHVVPVRQGGCTHVAGGRGACTRCNLDKELYGWSFEVADGGLPRREGGQRWDDVLDALLFDLENPSPPPSTGHRLKVRTPTGHEYQSTAPPTAGPTPLSGPP